jgi:hypothetical protein
MHGCQGTGGHEVYLQYKKLATIAKQPDHSLGKTKREKLLCMTEYYTVTVYSYLKAIWLLRRDATCMYSSCTERLVTASTNPDTMPIIIYFQYYYNKSVQS